MTIEERIKGAKLTKNEKKVLEFILQNIDRACYMTSSEIAKELNLGDTSVIRMAKSLGFLGYGEFKKRLTVEMLEKTSTKINPNLPFEKIKVTDSIELEKIPELVYQNIQYNLLNDYNRNTPNNYIEVAKKIVNSNKVYVAGFRNTYGFANYFSTILSHIIPGVIQFNNIGFEDLAIDMNEKDLLVLFSLPRYSQNALQITKIAKECKCPIVVITNQLISPVTEGANYVLTHNINSLSFANSVVGISLTMEILISLINKLAGEKGKKRLEKLEEYISKSKMF
ncbi:MULTISPECIES: MurR/RpiR family transcriptional regulator [Fusobacterium]|uniref:MurR/RpiR family transcriptional regulator n=1 Tax=Fusobacterium TaxID=848 RepID=UPI0014768553|nr:MULTISPECIES: MurR/RpiR family transcriptional regulator [Fusobacterium]NME35073.1 MurR/RpiR family transcriptional regulator [Fusobacterium sp. FSA-380-WT-3A]